ncbi:type I restriction enzyme ZgaDII, S subunit [Haloarcula marismortui ATCC 33800]|uniref:Type I restriction enzyme ZgaDII, S subunit n=2 Tax=Haloarcula marismortui TaxID=2238 RepID=M0K5U5_9EURY|nr:type I restriction enzyme ZgaDII, S subunit [Haloarcula sinaiiensis ATCC 33800]
MNQTLENLAQAIFEGHFVEFEPYNDFKETEKGPIPSEFEVANLPALMNIVLGGTPKSDVDEYYGGDITWAKAKDVSQETEAFISSTEKSITETGLEESSAELVPEGTTVITARGTVGETALTPYEMATNQTCYGLVPENNQEKYFLYFLVKTHIERLRSRTHGTVFDTINMNTLREQEIILPPKKNASNLMKALSQ